MIRGQGRGRRERWGQTVGWVGELPATEGAEGEMEGVGARCNFSEVHAISLSTLVALGKSFCQVIRSEFACCAVPAVSSRAVPAGPCSAFLSKALAEAQQADQVCLQG